MSQAGGRETGCARAIFVVEALVWLPLTLLAAVLLLSVQNIKADDARMRASLAEGIGLALGLLMTALCIHAAVKGKGLLTGRLAGNTAVTLALILSIVRVVFVGVLMFGLIIALAGITR